MHRIKIRLLISIFLISTINVLSANRDSKHQDHETYKVLKAVSKLYNYKLNREILLNKDIVKTMSSYTTYYSFCNSLYKYFEPVDIKKIIIEEDIIELQQNINIATSPKKWKRNLLKSYNIPTTRNMIGNQKSKTLYQTSTPVFFKNKNFSIVYIRQYCGSESGEKTIKIFRKNSSGTWEYFGEILIGIS